MFDRPLVELRLRARAPRRPAAPLTASTMRRIVPRLRKSGSAGAIGVLPYNRAAYREPACKHRAETTAARRVARPQADVPIVGKRRRRGKPNRGRRALDAAERSPLLSSSTRPTPIRSMADSKPPMTPPRAPGRAASASPWPNSSSATPRRSTSTAGWRRSTSRARSRTRGCSPRRRAVRAHDLAAIERGMAHDPRRDRARRIRLVARPRGRPPQHREAADGAGRRRRQAPAHRRARATTRSPPTSGCGCAARSTRSSRSSRALRRALLDLAERHADTIMPGFTHLQVAQPVTFGHHLLAYDEMFARDVERFADCRTRVNRLPLGAPRWPAPAIRSTASRRARTRLRGVCENSLDAVSDRDFADRIRRRRRARDDAPVALRRGADPVDEPALRLRRARRPLLHRLLDHAAEEEPRRRPSWCAARPARVNGHLVALLTLMKGQPLAYNKDNQEDKEPLFDTVDTLADTLRDHDRHRRRRHRRRRRRHARGRRARATRRPPISPTIWCARACRSAMRTRRSRARCATPKTTASTSPRCRSPSCKRSRRRSATTSSPC